MNAVLKHATAPLAVLIIGCSVPGGAIEPRHFQFATITRADPGKPGGWRAACVHAHIKNLNMGIDFVCKFGVGMPIQTKESAISIDLAQRIAADSANAAAHLVLMSAEADTLPGIVCQNFRAAYSRVLQKAAEGSRVNQLCEKGTTPVVFGIP